MDFQSGIILLNVSHNEIVDIPKKTFPKLYELHTIDFSHNKLSEIEKSVFINLLSLRHLYFQHNELADLVIQTLLNLLEFQFVNDTLLFLFLGFFHFWTTSNFIRSGSQF